MKKIKYLGLIFCLMFIPVLNINAEESVDEIKNFNVVTSDNIKESYKVDGSSVVAGNNIVVDNTVKGIDIVLGNSIDYKGNSDYTVLAGNVVNVSGITNNDSFIFGNAITFDKDYKNTRDLFVFGSSVVLRGEVTRDVTIYSSSVILEDLKVSGNVKIYAENIEIKNTNIDKTLSYNEDAKVETRDSIINLVEKYKAEEVTFADMVMNNIIDYASMLVVFVAFVLLLPGVLRKIEKISLENKGVKILSMLGFGIFYLIMIPIIFVLLMTISIGVPLGLILLILYIGVMFLSTIISGYYFGTIIWKNVLKKETNMLLSGLIGISIIKLLSLLPYIGLITVFISMLLSLSIFVKLFSKDS